LPDIEQAIMRECALYQARREVLPAEETQPWISDLLSGGIGSLAEAQSRARKQGHRLASHYSVLFLSASPAAVEGDESAASTPSALDARLTDTANALEAISPLMQTWEGGLAVLLPQSPGAKGLALLEEIDMPNGIGSERPLLEAPRSLAEAQLAAMASALLHSNKTVHYGGMGAERLLLILYRDHPQELRAFVDNVIGPLLQQDARSVTPLLPTLQAFIAHGGRLRETAAEIYVHRNTLAYRLDRAAEILRADLKDPSTRLAIELALTALPLVEGQGDV
jgi:hypothetical protein